MATPQITTRVPIEKQIAWTEIAERHGYNRTELIIALMDGAVDGSVPIPPKEPKGRCHFGDAHGCDQPHVVFPWAELCTACKFRFRG